MPVNLVRIVLFLLVMTLHCDKKKNQDPEVLVDPDEKNFKEELKNLLKGMSSVYLTTTKKIKKTGSGSEAASVLNAHLSQIKIYSQKMLRLEISEPVFFQNYKLKPPQESKRLRKLSENFLAHLTRLSFRYRQNKSFKETMEKIRAHKYGMEEEILSKVTTDFLQNQRTEIEAISNDLDHSLNKDQIKKHLVQALATLEQHNIGKNVLHRKSPDILKKHEKTLNIYGKLRQPKQKILKEINKISLKYNTDKNIIQNCSKIRELLLDQK